MRESCPIMELRAKNMGAWFRKRDYFVKNSKLCEIGKCSHKHEKTTSGKHENYRLICRETRLEVQGVGSGSVGSLNVLL